MQELASSSRKVLFFLGFLSIANAFYFSLGVNLRLFDIMFIIAPLYGVYKLKNGIIRYNSSINTPKNYIIFIFFYLSLSGLFSFGGYNDLYQDQFIKYWVHKVAWLLVYIMLYFIYGQDIVIYYLYGLTAMCFIHVSLVLLEYITIVRTGSTIDFSFLNTFFIQVEEKKYDVFNQGFIRPTGVTLDPNYATGYAGIGFLFCEYLKTQSGSKWYFTLFQLAALLIMILLFSRTGMFSILITFIISVFFSMVYKKRKIKTIAPKIFLIIICTAVALLSYIGIINEDFYKTAISRLSLSDGSSLMRSGYIVDYLENSNIIELLFGVGTSDAGQRLTELLYMNTGVVWSPESNFITFLIEQGILFLIFFFFFLTKIFFKLLKKDPIFAYIFLYINVMGVGYNFLGDRVYFFLLVILSMYAYDNNKCVPEYPLY